MGSWLLTWWHDHKMETSTGRVAVIGVVSIPLTFLVTWVWWLVGMTASYNHSNINTTPNNMCWWQAYLIMSITIEMSHGFHDFWPNTNMANTAKNMCCLPTVVCNATLCTFKDHLAKMNCSISSLSINSVINKKYYCSSMWQLLLTYVWQVLLSGSGVYCLFGNIAVLHKKASWAG